MSSIRTAVRRVMRLTPALQTVVFAGALTALAMTLLSMMPASSHHGGIALVVGLTVAFLAAEGLPVHLPAKRDSHTISLVEIPLILALVYVAPVQIVVTRIIGSGAALVFVRKQTNPVKLGFNLSMFALETSAAAFVFSTIAATHPATDPLTWLALGASLLAFQTLGALAVSGVLWLNDTQPELSDFVRNYLIGLMGATMAGAWGLVTIAVIEAAPLASVPLTGLAVGLYWLLGVFGRLRRRHEDLKVVHSFTTALDAVNVSTELPGLFLETVNAHFMTSTAVLLSETGGQTEVLTLEDDPGLHLIMTNETDGFSAMTRIIGPEARLLDDEIESRIRKWTGVHLDGGAAIPIPGKRAVLLLGNPRPGHTIGSAELAVLETLGAHAGSAFERHRLFGALADEVELRQYQALHDELTDLPNRAAFLETVGEMLRTPHTDDEVGVLLLDIDDFKSINDTLSHKAGDQVLVDLAHRLTDIVRNADVIARVGGDEFAVGVRIGSEADAIGFAQRIKEGLTHPFISAGLRVEVGASIGITVGAPDAITMLRRADIAMYEAKKTEAGIELYSDSIDTFDAPRLQLAGELRAAIEAGDVKAYYQPKVRASDGSIAGFETLARWIHPTRGMVSPGEFIPIAESTGLMLPLTEHILETSLLDARSWADRHWTVSVNFSARTLSGSRPDRIVAAALARTGVDPSALVVEVTEGGIIHEGHDSTSAIEGLQELGVKISIDDFGTGYSSMSRLRNLPIGELKIDRSFISTFEADAGNRAIVEATLTLAQQLGLETVAEGVEEESTLVELRRLGVDQIQGFYYSPALPVAALWDWIADHERRNGLRAVS